MTRARAFARVAIDGLLSRKGRFDGIGHFESAHIRIDRDGFVIDGFDVAPGKKSKPLVMTFKKPEEVVGNHIAKYQSVKLAKMVMAYDFDRELNPFVELGGFLFTFIGDGAPGTGKTTLIQMIAGLVNDYCHVAGYPFVYENFGVDQISSYQGKSGQNCRQFINNVLNPRAIGFGTIDDIDQVAARRSDDRASAGQQEITGVLMEAFAGASTVVRGNCSFGMFSNYPENVDDALRQRAGARWLVDGPQTLEDYIDIFVLLAGKNHKIPLGDHKLYAAQEIKKAVTEAYEEHAKPQEEGLERVYERFMKEHGEPKVDGRYRRLSAHDQASRAALHRPRHQERHRRHQDAGDGYRAAGRLVFEAGNLHAQGLRREEGDDRGTARSVLDGHGDAGDQPLRQLRIPLFRQVGRCRGEQDAARRPGCASARGAKWRN